MLRQAGVKSDIAAARAQILYWAFLGYALSDQPLPQAQAKSRHRRIACHGHAINLLPRAWICYSAGRHTGEQCG